MRLVFLRHPRPKVAPGTCYGRTDLAEAESAAAEIAAALALTPQIALVLASPARRCTRLAARLAARDGVAHREDPRLWELDFGQWEMRPWAEIPRAESDPWARDPWRRAPPGGESFGALHARLAAVLGDLAGGPSPVAVVAHAGPIRAARMILAGESFEDAFARPVPYATPLVIGARTTRTRAEGR